MVRETPPAPSSQIGQEFATSAWLAEGLGRESGWLVYRDGQLAFYDHSGGVVFDSGVGQLDAIEFPWYYWGVGCRIRVCGETFRLNFAPPQGGRPSLRIQGLHAPAIDALCQGAAEPRDIGAVWRQLLRRAS